MHFYNSQDNGDRFFMVPKDDGFEEIKLSGQAAEGLVKMNSEKRNETFDLRFIKGMLIGFCTVKKVKDFKSYKDLDELNSVLLKGKVYPLKNQGNYYIV